MRVIIFVAIVVLFIYVNYFEGAILHSSYYNSEKIPLGNKGKVTFNYGWKMTWYDTLIIKKFNKK